MLPLLLFVSALTFVSLNAAPAANPCVDNAHFNATTRQCSCNDGFKGSSRLCCGPKAEGVCYLISDPMLNTAHDLISEISFPCTTSIAVVKKVIDGQECRVRITIAGPYRPDSSLFYNSAAVYLEYGGSTRYFEMLDGKQFRMPEESNDTLTMLTKITKDIKVGDYTFSVNFEDVNDRWVINGCGGQLVFRSPGPDTQESRPPGICVIAPTDTIAESLSEGEVCNLEPGYDHSPYATREQSILANMILGYPKITARHNFDPANYRASCRALSNNFSACGDDRDRARALKNCGHILLGFRNRQCFSKAPKGLFAVFASCIKASCQRDRLSCTEIQVPEIRSCLPALQKCDTW